MSHEELEQTIRDLFLMTEKLNREYGKYSRKFTPDGHLIGSIGEVFVAEAFDLDLCKNSTPDYDATTRDAFERNVQIKATQTNRISLSTKSTDPLPHLIVIKIKPTGKWTLVYNGPGKPVWEAAGKPQKNGQRQISLAKLRRIAESIPVEEQLSKRVSA